MAENKIGIVITVKDTFSKGLDKLRKGLNVMKKAVLAASAATVALGIGFAKIAKSTAATGDLFQKMAQKIGVSATALSELKFAAEISGASIQEVGNSLRLLSKRMLDAKQGLAEAKRSFEALNIEVTDTTGNLKAADAVFLEAVEAINKLGSETEKTALAQELFGRSGANLLPLIRLGKEGIQALREEATKLGITFSDIEANQAAEFNDSMLRLGSAFTGLKNQIGKELIPAFSEIAKAVTKSLIQLRTQEGFEEWAQKVAKGVVGAFQTMVIFILGLPATFQKVISTLNKTLAVVNGLFQGIIKLARLADNALSRLEGEDPSQFLADLDRATEGVGVMFAEAALKADDSAKELLGLVGKFQQDLNSQIEAGQGEGGLAGLVLSPESVEQTKDKLDETKEAILTWKDELEIIAFEIRETFTSNIGAAFADIIVDGKRFGDALVGVFKSLAKSFIQAIGQMIAKWLVFKAITGIGGLLAAPLTGGASLLGGVPLNLAGAAFGGTGATGGVTNGGLEPVSAAAGGVFKKPTLAVIGDNAARQEAVIPLRGGKVPVEGGTGGMQIGTVNILPNANVDEALLTKSESWWRNVVSRRILPALNSLGDRNATTSLRFRGSQV